MREVLTAKNGQFWDLYARRIPVNNPRLPGIRYTYHVYADGTCFCYVNNRNGTMCLFDGGDILLSHTWRVAADTLTIDDRPYPVIRISPDSIFLKVTFSVGLEHRIVPDTLILFRTHRRPIAARDICE